MDIRSFARWDAGDTDGAVHDMQEQMLLVVNEISNDGDTL